jgi:putative nucleotidyltransferase with HDIG domain
MKKEEAAEVVTLIFHLFNKKGDDMYIGEPVTKYQHMVQSAMIAQQLGYSDEMVIAALLHDIGHVCVEMTPENDMNGFGIKNHDLVGAELLRENGFSALVVSAVENHVAAKRYLCTKFQNYFDQLSLASLETLKLQGGIMNETEILEFESHPYFDENIKIRKIDELAKEEHMEIVAVESFKEILLNHLIN